jgi:hypothetical protein
VRSSVGTELPAALGQECVCSSTQANTLAVDGFPPWRCRFVCDSASRESVAGHWGESRVTAVGCWWGSSKTGPLLVLMLGLGLLGFWALDQLQCSTAPHCTELYCTRACMMQTRMLVSVGCTRSFTTKLDASLAGAAARNLQPTWEFLRRR